MKKRKTEDVPPISPGLNLSEALEELAAPAYVMDREGRYRWANRAYIELLGDPRGQTYVDDVAPEHRQLARMNFARKVVGEASTIFDLLVLDRRGDRIAMRVTSAPLRRDDEVVGVFGIGVPLDEASITQESHQSVLSDLTPRQLEVLRLLGDGLETQEIAARLGIADETARNHIRALLRAMGAHSRLEAVVTGLRSGLLGPDLTHAGQEGSEESADQ